jgi:hypothetical protein
MSPRQYFIGLLAVGLFLGLEGSRDRASPLLGVCVCPPPILYDHFKHINFDVV